MIRELPDAGSTTLGVVLRLAIQRSTVCRQSGFQLGRNCDEKELIMNLHVYQAKQLFAEYGLPVSKGIAVDSGDEAADAAKEIGGDRWVVKAQVTPEGEAAGGQAFF